jgi:hypothetical protein
VIERLERLQSRGIYREGEVTIADTERTLRVDGGDVHRVPLDERLTIDGRRPANGDENEQEREQGAKSDHGRAGWTGGGGFRSAKTERM